MKIDCHMHTSLCGHAGGTPKQYVEEAKRKGIDLITFTCHVPIADPGFLQNGIRMSLSQFDEYKIIIREASHFGEQIGVEVLLGIEAEVCPDETKLTDMDHFLSSNEFDFILGSLHHQLPVFRNWLREKFFRSDTDKIDAYFRQLTNGVASRRYNSMSHPDVIRIYGTVNHFEPQDHEELIRHFLQTLVENDVCMEVNTSGLGKGVYKVHPDPMILDWAKELGVNLTIGSDAHRPNQVGQFFPRVLAMLKEKGFEHLHYFRNGEIQRIPLEL